MIKIGKIWDGGKYDERYVIARSVRPDYRLPEGSLHEPQLSPSVQLLCDYRSAVKKGIFDERWFQQIYVPRFISELCSDRRTMVLLDQLYNDGMEKDILLACFCSDEALCHRSIVAGILLGAGAKVECNADYAKYHRMFMNELAKK